LAVPEALPLPQKAVPLGKVASPQAMTEGVSAVRSREKSSNRKNSKAPLKREREYHPL
jgi:hypothetical protein